jgi:hypothetical protein
VFDTCCLWSFENTGKLVDSVTITCCSSVFAWVLTQSICEVVDIPYHLPGMKFLILLWSSSVDGLGCVEREREKEL